jgi:DNA-binding transcriptional regulator YiaG
MKKPPSKKKTPAKLSVGQEVIASLKEAIAWAAGEDVPVKITKVEVPKTDVRAVRRKLHLSQSQFAAKFGFEPATLKNWEQGRLAAPEPEILRIIGEESKRKGTDKLTSREIDQEIKAVRAAKRKRG